MVLSILQRRGFTLALGCGTVAGALMLGSGATAAADPPPGCSAADLAQTMSGVSSATADYLFSHPDVNAFFSGLRGQTKDAMHSQIHDYLNANPNVRDDLRNIRQPLKDMRNRCGPFVAHPQGSNWHHPGGPPPAATPAPPPPEQPAPPPPEG